MVDLKNLVEQHEYSCLLCEITNNEICNKIFYYSLEIPEELITEHNLFEPHITLFYGIHSSESKIIEPYINFLRKNKPIQVTLGRIKKFSKPENDVIYIEVLENKIFNKIHNHILVNVENTTKFSKYTPHITLAYVESNSCDELLQDDIFLNSKFTIDILKFNSNESNKTKYFYI